MLGRLLASFSIWISPKEALFRLMESDSLRALRNGKLSVFTPLFYFAILMLCTIFMIYSLHFIKKHLNARSYERKILQTLEANENVLFSDVSADVGCSGNEVVEMAKQALARGDISGAITFDESGFIPETELRQAAARKDAPLNELIAEISKIRSPIVKDFDPRVVAKDGSVHSLKMSVVDEVTTKGHTYARTSSAIKTTKARMSRTNSKRRGESLKHPRP